MTSRPRSHHRLLWQALVFTGVLVVIGWSSSGAKLDVASPLFQQKDRVEALRTCKLALSRSHRVVATYDVTTREVAEAGITRVHGSVLVRAAPEIVEAYQYRCDYNTYDGKVSSVELFPTEGPLSGDRNL